MTTMKAWTLRGGSPRPKSQRLAWDPDYLRGIGEPPTHPVSLRSIRAVWRKTQERAGRQPVT